MASSIVRATRPAAWDVPSIRSARDPMPGIAQRPEPEAYALDPRAEERVADAAETPPTPEHRPRSRPKKPRPGLY